MPGHADPERHLGRPGTDTSVDQMVAPKFLRTQLDIPGKKCNVSICFCGNYLRNFGEKNVIPDICLWMEGTMATNTDGMNK